MNKTAKRIISCILVLVMTFSASLPVYAQSAASPDTYNIKNEYVEYFVNSKNGGFVIKTVEGSMLRKSDENKHLLFQGENYDTSFTTFRIGGKDYIFGNGYGFLGMGGSFVSRPRNVGAAANSATWGIGEVEITQTLELINDKSNPNLGNVKITYTAVNKGKADVSIGARILLDTMLDNNDGAPFELGDTALTKVTTEKRLAGSEIPQYWKSMDSLAMPNVVAYGFTSGWGNRKPDEMVIGHWNNLAAAKWDYTIDPTIDFTRTDSKYGTADSAVAMYWTPAVLKAGSSVTYETHYGIMAQNLADQTAGFAVNAYAGEKKLTVDSTGKAYTNNGEFVITAEVDNSITGAADLSNVVATLLLEDGLQLAEGEARSKFVQSLAKGNRASFTWSVKAAAQSKYSIKQFKVDVQPNGYAEPVSAGDYILLPGLVQTQPKILFGSIAPARLYYQGAKYINIKGSGFDYYRDKGNWEMRITDMNGKETPIPDENVVIVDNEQMTVRIDGDFAIGEYGITVEWSGGSMPQGTVQTLPLKFAMTNNPKDRNDYYGILCIVRSGNNYELKTFKDEYELASHISAHGKGSIMLELRGYITKLTGSDNSYLGDTSLDPVVINNIVVYRGQPMSIKKEKGKVVISGDGPIQVIGALTFWKWGFEIVLEDGSDYTLDRAPASGQEQLQINLMGLGSMIQAIGGFTMDLKYGVFQREEKDGAYYNQISFGGKMSLPVFPGGKSKEDDSSGGSGGSSGSGGNTGKEDEGMPELGSFSVDMRDVLFGERKDKEQGFIGIDTTLGIEIPDNAFGGVIENGFEAELTINTIDHIYGVSFTADIMVLECEGTLTIRLHEGKYPVPDELKFTGGGDPGIPVVPGILYVTKLGGGYSKLYESIFGDAWLPPITLHLTAGASLFAVLELETDQEISLSGYSMSGSASLRGIPVLDNFSLSLSWVDPIYAQVSATITLYAVIKGTASIYISPDYLEGWARVVIEIPGDIPFVGGEVLAGAEVGISTVRVWGKIIVLGLGLGVAYYWSDEKVEFITMDREYPLPDSRYAYGKLLEGEDGQKYSMLVGTNTHLLASSKSGYRYADTELCMAGDARGYFKEDILLAASTIKNEYQVTIPAGQKAAYLQIQYYGEKPAFTVLKPDGSEYSLVEHTAHVDGNFKWQTMPTGEKYAFISLVGMDSIDGNWTVRSSEPIDITLMGVDPLPELKGVTFTEASNVQKQVSWTIDNPGGATASVYIAKAADDPGVLAAQDIDAASGGTVINIPDTLQNGEYFIRVAVKKGDSYFQSRLSENSFRYANANQPGRVEAIAVSPIGNGCFRIDVTDTQDNIDGYIIEAYDSAGNKYESFTPQYFKKGDEIIAGGWIPTEVLDKTKEVYKGLEPGKTYILSAAPCRKIGDKTYIGEALMSAPVLLPAPKPANITLDCDESFKDIQGEAAKITNSNIGVFSFTSDQEVTSSIKLDGLAIGSPRTGRQWSVTVPAEDGSHLLRVVSRNENGDASEASILYTVDTAAPQLLIESPRPGDIYTGGRLAVKGIFEKGAKYTISIDGENIYKDSDLLSFIEDGGRTDMTIDMSNKAKKLVHELKISAADTAGNITVYEAQVIDGSLETLKKVHIREKTAKRGSLEEIELEAGEKRSFALIGTDGNGNEIELNNAQTGWRILSGSAMAYVSEEGEINALLPGEAVVLGSYKLDENYSLEDALVVRVKPEKIIPPGDDDNDNDSDKDRDRDNYNYPAGQVQITGTGRTATSVFGADMLQSLIDRAAVNEEGKKIITITLPAVAGAGGYSAGIPIPYIAGAAGNVEFRIVTPFGTISIPGSMLQGAGWLQNGNYGNDRLIYLSITPVDTASLPAGLRGQIGSRPAVSLSLSLDGKRVQWSNPDAPVTVSVPYTPSQEEKKEHEHITVWYIDGTGNPIPVPSGRYDPSSERVGFTTTHFSSFAVVFVKKGFKDTADTPWAKKQIEVLASKGILRETGKDLYSPKKSITRADFLYSLVRTLGLDASFRDNFSDVASGKYYYKELGIARKLGITEGVGGNRFNPDGLLTRQDMMTMTARALEKLKKLKSAGDSAVLDSFRDKGDISAYAVDKVAVMVKEGLIVGSGGRINPRGNTTRAEAAVLLYRIYNK